VGKALSFRERQDALERFSRGCSDALRLLSGPLPSEAERREAARGLGEEHRLPDPQGDLPLGAA
jgi:hypothetical protein